MTNIEFNQYKLKKRLDFRMSEACRFVLVHGGSVDESVKLYSVSKAELLAAIVLFETPV